MMRSAMMQFLRTGKGVLLLWGMLAAVPAYAADPGAPDPVAEALKGDWGQIMFNIRYRWEHVEQDGLKTTNGDPLRLRLGYLTPKFGGFQGFAEFEGDTAVFANDYNDLTNGKTDYAVIADPDGKGELNRGWLAFTSIPDTTIKGGRQRIILDNARFIGNVGWRQMEQTYDGGRITNTSLPGLSLDAVYIWNVRNILSKDDNMDSWLFHGAYKMGDIGRLAAYGYLLDFDDQATKSSQTFGIRFKGDYAAAENFNLLYLAEYANQSDYQDNPSDFNVDYYHLYAAIKVPDAGAVFKDLTAKIAYEFHGSDNNTSFQTPLGTNHAFNGWVDKFLTIPPEGLKDYYGMLSCTVQGVTAKIFYHDFKADEGGADYGDEFDAMLNYKFGKHYAVTAAYGTYNADEFSVDTNKFWLALDVNF